MPGEPRSGPRKCKGARRTPLLQENRRGSPLRGYCSARRWGSLRHHRLLHQEHQDGNGVMEKVRVFLDREGTTLTVWFDDPKKEHVCEESDDDIVLVKDRRGRVIGFERLNFLSAKQLEDGAGIPLEVQMI